jgi:hypothetical protein
MLDGAEVPGYRRAGALRPAMQSLTIEDISGASRTGRRRAIHEDRFGWFAGARVVALADGLASRLAVDAVARMKVRRLLGSRDLHAAR